MNKKIYVVILSIFFSISGISTASAQSSFLSKVTSAVSSVVSSVTDEFTTLSVDQIAGTWKYNGSACTFESDDLLTQSGGAVVATQVNSKLSEVYSKVGITADKLGFTFGSDNTFSMNVMGKSVSGTFSLDSSTKIITLSFSAVSSISLGSITATLSKSGDALSICFNADKLLTILTSVGEISQISTLETITSLASTYDGLLLGFEMVQ